MNHSIERLLHCGGHGAYDAEGMAAAQPLLSGVTFAFDACDRAHGADEFVIVTEWNAFRALDFARLRDTMNAPVLIDLRNVYSHENIEPLGFKYVGIGRKS